MTGDNDVPSRQKLLEIIDSNLTADLKESRIRALDGRRPWRYLTANILPKMRKVELQVNWLHHESTVASVSEALPEPKAEEKPAEAELPPIELKADTVVVTEIPATDEKTEIIAAEEIVTIQQETIETAEWQKKLYLKTNAPAWGLLLINAAVEMDLAPHWSVQLPIYYSGFNYFHSDTKFRTTAIIPEIRFWPDADNTGFYANAHLGVAWFNYAKGGKYRYQDHLRHTPAIGGGIGAGYRFHFCNNPRWTMEASLGVGIYRLDYDIFDNRHNGLITGRRQRTFYGIDQAALSFTYSFDLNK